MSQSIFVSLPVADLVRARAFYEAVGFANDPRFTDQTAAGMVWGEHLVVMLMTREKWAEFTDRPIPDRGSSEVAIGVAVESRAAVDAFAEAAAANGGVADVNPVQDHGFMYGRDVLDPDGHVWAPMWMDEQAAGGEGPLSA